MEIYVYVGIEYKGNMVTTNISFDQIFSPTEYYYVDIEYKYKQNKIKEIDMSNLYRQYISMLVLVTNISSISF